MRKTISKHDWQEIALRCDCGCSTIVFSRCDWDDDGKFIDYEICYEDGYFCNCRNKLRKRIMYAFKILFGKTACRASVSCQPKELHEFLNAIQEMTKNDK